MHFGSGHRRAILRLKLVGHHDFADGSLQTFFSGKRHVEICASEQRFHAFGAVRHDDAARANFYRSRVEYAVIFSNPHPGDSKILRGLLHAFGFVQLFAVRQRIVYRAYTVGAAGDFHPARDAYREFVIARFAHDTLAAHFHVERCKAHIARQLRIYGVGIARENTVQKIKFIVGFVFCSVADFFAYLVRSEFFHCLFSGELIAAIYRVNDAVATCGGHKALRQRPLLKGKSALFLVLIDVQREPASTDHIEIGLVPFRVKVSGVDIFPYQRCAGGQPRLSVIRQ